MLMALKTQLTDSQQLTENVQDVQGGLDIPGVLSKSKPVNLLKQYIQYSKLDNSVPLLLCLQKDKCRST